MVGEKNYKKFAKPLFIVILLITVGLGFLIPNIRFDYDFEKFFPADDADTKYYFQHRDTYQSDNDFLLVAIEREDGIFNKEFLDQVDKLSSEIEKLKYVNFVRSITSEKELFLLTGGIIGRKPFYNSDKKLLKEDSTRIYKHNELLNNLIAKDGKSLCIFIKHEDFLPGKKSTVLIDQIQQKIDQFSFEKTRIAGRTIAQKFFIKKMTSELLMFLLFSIILIIAFLWIAFKSLWGLMIPQIVLVFALVWVLGFMVVFDEPINVILSILPCIMFVVTMSYVIHPVSRYLDYLRQGMTKYEAIKISFREVGVSTFLTAFTTSIGFIALIFINVQPIQSFGIVTGIGVMIAFILTIVLLPISFYIFPSPRRITETKDAPYWNRFLRKLFVIILRKRKAILIISAVITVVFSLFTLKLESNNYMLDDLRADEPIKQDFNFLDKHYGGIRPLELAINIKGDRDCWDLEVLQEVNKIENYLINDYKAKINVSLVHYLKVLNQSSHLGNPEYFRLPETKREIRKLRRPIKFAEKGQLFKVVVDSTEKNMRISANIPDWGKKRVNIENEKFDAFLKKNVNPEIISVRHTGTALLLDKSMGSVSYSLVEGLIVSIVMIIIIMVIVYRSLKLVILSVIPNIIPLVILSGTMGIMNVDLKISTAVIFTISLGIAFDDTIQFLAKFKIELDKGKSKLYALKTAYLVTGKGMILSSLIVCSGFLTMLFSSFTGTFLLGFMISMTLFVALISDIVLLPVLMLLFYHPKRK
ncbi:MAG: putative superfamily exporter [Crocinitomicaceae bacterium]|jgi:predicted RND superfamily exporter protein|nr:putative superfamily exporter [Crocinitomicaceae bacterium]